MSSAHRERPILFSGPMVRAILEGRKTQTRRTMEPQPTFSGGFYEWGAAGWSDGIREVRPVPGHSLSTRCPYGVVGDRLYVREAWRADSALDAFSAAQMAEAAHRAGYSKPWAPIQYEADKRKVNWDPSLSAGRYRHARFMPRWACRLVLEVTEVRVQRLLDISAHDAIAEGIEPRDFNDAVEETAWAVGEFALLWDSINAKRAPWASNPWVWAVSFKRIEP